MSQWWVTHHSTTISKLDLCCIRMILLNFYVKKQSFRLDFIQNLIEIHQHKARILTSIGILYHSMLDTFILASRCSELSKLFASLITSIDLQHIESHGLAKRSTLSNCNIITLLNTETRRNMSSKILVTFLVPIVFLHVMKIITTLFSNVENGNTE